MNDDPNSPDGVRLIVGAGVDILSTLTVAAIAIANGSLPEFVQLKLVANSVTHIGMDVLDRPINRFLQQRGILEAGIPEWTRHS